MIASPPFVKVDLSKIAGRVLVIGDVHGCFSLLDRRLLEMRYDPEKDKLVFLGDLIDRGPENLRAMEIIEAGHLRIAGNHEDMYFKAFNSKRMDENSYWYYTHTRNGGGWMNTEDNAFNREFSKRLMNVPVVLEIRTPAGNKIGCIHAGTKHSDWRELEKAFDTATGEALLMEDLGIDPLSDLIETCLWDRSFIGGCQMFAANDRIPKAGAGNFGVIQGIDHVFFGHTPVTTPFTYGNCSFIDTKAFSTRNLTIIDVDEFLRNLQRPA
jgi:serine/threonine protein phosphatase 1